MNFLKIDNVGSIGYVGSQLELSDRRNKTSHDAIPEVCFDAGAEFNLNFFDTPAADDSNTQGGFSDAGSIEESNGSICGSPPPSTAALIPAERSATVGLTALHQQSDGSLHNQSVKHEIGNNDRLNLLQPMSPNKCGKDYIECFILTVQFNLNKCEDRNGT